MCALPQYPYLEKEHNTYPFFFIIMWINEITDFKSPLQIVNQCIIIVKIFMYYHPYQAVQSNRETFFSKSLFTREIF